MARTKIDDLHNHATWGPLLRPESVEYGRLHRHRISDPYAMPRFTSWEHNGQSHSHRLPDGAWTRPRVDLRPAHHEIIPRTPEPGRTRQIVLESPE